MMQKTLLFLLFSFLPFFQIQSGVGPLILEKEKEFYPLGLYLDILEDKKGLLTIEDVNKAKWALKFKRNTVPIPNFGYSSSAFWLRLNIKNNLKKKRQWLLSINVFYQDNIQYFKKIKENWVVETVGDTFPASKRKIDLRPFIFEIKPSTDETVFFRVKSPEGAGEIDLSLSTPMVMAKTQSKSNLFYGLFFGFILSMAIYNFFIFFISRKRSFLYYVFYILFFGLTMANYKGFIPTYLFRNNPWFSNNGYTVSIGMTGLCLNLFILSYLEINKTSRKLYYSFSTMNIILCLIIFLSSFSEQKWPSILLNIFIPLTILLAIIAGVDRVRKNFRPAQYFLAAFFILTLSILILAMVFAGLLPSNFFTNQTIFFGSSLEMIFLSMGLADKISFHQKNALNNEQNMTTLLEQYTKNLKEKNWELEILQLQEKEDLLQLQKMYDEIEKRKAYLEEEVEKRTKDLKHSQEEKSLFFAKLSHELRTPLNAILGFSDIMLSLFQEDSIKKERDQINKGNEQRTEYMECIKSSGHSLLKLINEIHDFTKIDLSKFKVFEEEMSLKNLLKNLSTFFLHQSQQKGLQFFLEIDDQLPTTIWSDEPRLKQVLNNVLGNALKFTTKGSITLKCYGTFYEDNKNIIDLHIIVLDTGVGIKKEKLKSIFKSFSQVHEENAVKDKGSGLGLFISEKIIENLRGSIQVESRFGHGSQFKINLKSVKVGKQNKQKFKTESIYKFFGETILVADDIPSNLTLIKAYLDPFDLDILTVSNGSELVQRSKDLRPSLIITDYNMPKMDGHAVMKELKSTEETKNIPIIVLTAFKIEDSMKKEFQGFLNKPIEKNILLEKISDFLKHEKRIISLETEIQKEKVSFLLPDLLNEDEIQILLKMKDEFKKSLELQDITAIENLCSSLKKDFEKTNLRGLINWVDTLYKEVESFHMEAMNDLLKQALHQIETRLKKEK
jgi:signal transduction histidine kinase/DNA-binding response OmpR family regulator